MLQVEQLYFYYGERKVLDNVSITLKKGSVTALVGPNGAGKTSLMRCMAGLEYPMAGCVRLHDMDVHRMLRHAHKAIAFLPDGASLFTGLTLRQSLLFKLESHKIPRSMHAQRVAEVVADLDVAPLLDRPVVALSAGQRQKVSLAQAIVHRPDILLADEPASALDPDARAALSQLFLKLQKQGMTILVSSHILSELEDYCTDMIVLKAGKVRSVENTALKEASPAVRVVVQLATPCDLQPQVQAWGQGNGHETLLCTKIDPTTYHVHLPMPDMAVALLQALVLAQVPVQQYYQLKETLMDRYTRSTRMDEESPIETARAAMHHDQKEQNDAK